MKTKRTKRYEQIVRDVMNHCYSKYSKELNGEKCWTLYHGDKRMYKWDENVSCVSFELHNSGSLGETTIVSAQFNIEEIAATLLSHELYVDSSKELRRRTGEYLSSERGAWGS